MNKHSYENRVKYALLNSILLCTITFYPLVIAASETPAETLAWAETLCDEVSEMSFKAIVTCDYHGAQYALNVVDDATHLTGELAKKAHKAADAELAWAVFNTCNQIEAAIVNLIKAAKSIAYNSRDPETSHSLENLLELCIAVQKKNEISMDMALLTVSGVVEKQN